MKEMKYKLLHIVIISSFIAVMTGCAGKKEQSTETNTYAKNEKTPSTLVSLTNSQKNSLNITTGKITTHRFNEIIEANGILSVMPQSEASISPYIGANVKAILVKEGQVVSRGQILAYLSHPDLLDLQSRYLTAYNRMTYISQEYNRQKELYKEKVGAGKDFQQIQSEYNSLLAELRTSETQLNLIGINPVSVRNGKIFSSITVTSPINGTIENINIKTGQYADSQTQMFRIVNIDNVYADLLVFEKDIPLVKVGRKVSLSLKTTTG